MSEFNFRVIFIHGVPRSGTSWLGQVFASHPQVAYRFQPLFAYRFKDRLHANSSSDEVRRFLEELYQLQDDPFILDLERRQALSSFWRRAYHDPAPAVLVIKMVRYHHLIPLFLEYIPNVQIIGIVRHPCAVINSWLQAPKEFRPGWNPMEEWRYAPRKNAGRIEEYHGFEKWKEVAYQFLELEQSHPDQFSLVQYEPLVAQPEMAITELFSSVNLPIHPQTLAFIQLSRSGHDPDPYAVLKSPAHVQRWQHELDPRIIQAILNDVRGSRLERFLQ